MGGTLDPKYFERLERERQYKIESDLGQLTKLVKNYLQTPSELNKRKLKEFVYPPGPELSEQHWNLVRYFYNNE